MPLDKMVPELYSTNIERTIAFYVESLGFKILYQRPEEKFVYMELGPTQMMFEELGIGRNWITAELVYPLGRGMNFQIPVSDATGLHDAFKAKGYPIFLPLEEKWYRRDDVMVGNRQFIVQDPDGYLLRLAQDLGSKPIK